MRPLWTGRRTPALNEGCTIMKQRYRTGWISDLHLGSRGCNAVAVLDFLNRHDFDKLYVVGDLLDIWKLRRVRYWPQSHTDVIQRLLKKAHQGAQIVFIPGNHDEFCTNFLGAYGNIRVAKNDLHVTADGRRLMVMHGHEFDCVTKYARWVAVIGDMGYSLLLHVNRYFNLFRRLFGFGYWSLSAYIKRRVKNSVNFIGQFEDMVVKYAERHRADGIVCGHIHTAAIRRMQHVEYFNIGDWVESCTALVEHDDGRIELVDWTQKMQRMTLHADRQSSAA